MSKTVRPSGMTPSTAARGVRPSEPHRPNLVVRIRKLQGSTATKSVATRIIPTIREMMCSKLRVLYLVQHSPEKMAALSAADGEHHVRSLSIQ
ncbi:hypothetical protein ACVWYQ_004709 [Bradyrhizobium sp. USDA 3397]